MNIKLKIIFIFIVLSLLSSCGYETNVQRIQPYQYYVMLIKIKEIFILIMIILNDKQFYQSSRYLFINIFNRIYYAYLNIAILLNCQRDMYNFNVHNNHSEIWKKANFKEYYKFKSLREKYDYSIFACINKDNKDNIDTIIVKSICDDLKILYSLQNHLSKLVRSLKFENKEFGEYDEIIKDELLEIRNLHNTIFLKLKEVIKIVDTCSK